MSKFIFSILLLCQPFLMFAQSEEANKKPAQQTDTLIHQLRFSADASKFLSNALVNNKQSYEMALDYYWHKELYLVSEAGWGFSKIDYPDLKYTSDNVFMRLGIDKALFERKHVRDWGMAFVGFRYGIAILKRGAAEYTTNDHLGGIASGVIPSINYTVHWLELTGGMRVELLPHLFAGWNMRVKFLMNPNASGDLKPAFIAGYGAGDKSSAFDYNVYLAYALRWSAKK
jgi:hypothetical protein